MVRAAAGRSLGRRLALEDGPADSGIASLGYRLRRNVWGRGYATEGARALVRRAFTELRVDEVVATTMAVNVGSRRVMEKAGLRYVRTVHLEWEHPVEGNEHGDVEYRLRRSDWMGQPVGVLRVRGRALTEGEPRDLYADGDRWTTDPVAGAELVAEGWLPPGLVDAHTHLGAVAPGQLDHPRAVILRGRLRHRTRARGSPRPRARR